MFSLNVESRERRKRRKKKEEKKAVEGEVAMADHRRVTVWHNLHHMSPDMSQQDGPLFFGMNSDTHTHTEVHL